VDINEMPTTFDPVGEDAAVYYHLGVNLFLPGMSLTLFYRAMCLNRFRNARTNKTSVLGFLSVEENFKGPTFPVCVFLTP
jgi:hypothetical protein